ncbi:helix-turn-helix domain-containing protein [Clostridium pasteurianum]|uniref:Resolvase family protein n=1 Tax=Clostridium pasteurianum BC1 TaxID=86416 RepID=R4KHE1_CLOPA|nr:helix-turn-helix domain-containing protein [Clostridium pasteurianum]AGK99015.1 resolvase family protein [Clostridium pasteurianum BC1]
MAYDVLTVKQNDMVTMLIQGETITDIAKKLGVVRQTVYDWMAKDNIKAVLDRRRQDLTNQGNRLILKDINTYIGNIKELANDDSDKRVCLAANQYLLNRILGNPTTSIIDANSDDNDGSISELVLEERLKRFKVIKK